MKNTVTGKTIMQILSVLLCAVIIIMITACFHPYFTISEMYSKFLNPNPGMDHYSMVDVMWCNTDFSDFGEDNKFNPKRDFSTLVIRDNFEKKYEEFNYNDYVTAPVVGFLMAIATVATALWFARNEFKRYPSTTSAIFCHITGIACGAFTLVGYTDNAMLDLGVPKFMFIRQIIIICGAAVLVLSMIRLVIWILTAIQLRKERKARFALL